MPPFRTVSLWKNQVFAPHKREEWNAEVNSHKDLSDSCAGLTCSLNDEILAKSTLQGHLIRLPLNQGKKHAQNAPSQQVASAPIIDFVTDPFSEPLLAVATNDAINVLRHDFGQSRSILKSDDNRGVRWHSHARGLLLSTSHQEIKLWDIEKESSFTTLSSKNVSDACFGNNGAVASTSKASVQIWDPRTSTAPTQESKNGHAGLKASHITAVGELYLTTGTSRTRDREYSLWDARNFVKPFKTQRIDANTGTLFPLVDVSRRLVYLVGRGDMFINWIEVGSEGTISEGYSQLPQPILGTCLIPPKQLNVMQTEINRLYISSQDGNIIPVSVSVPRRQYIDFHPDLFPSCFNCDAAISATKWLEGSNDLRQTVPFNAEGVLYNSSSNSTISQQSSITTKFDEKPTVTQSVKNVTSINVEPQQAARVPSNVDTKPLPSDSSSTDPLTPVPSTKTFSSTANQALTALSNPPTSYSRNFLIGKTPLKAAYESVSDVATVSPPHMALFKANDTHFMFPLAGPGGRIVVHPLSETGRFPLQVQHVEAGSSIVSFDLDPFEDSTVFVGCEDGKIRKLKLGQPITELHDVNMDHIIALLCHPAAANVLASISEDSGAPHLRIWNADALKAGLTISLVAQPFDFAWSSDGSRIAVISKDKKIRSFDPRQPDVFAEGSAHDSIRLMKVAWIDNHHLISTGFTRSADREVMLHKIEGTAIRCLHKLTLDISPAPLFPHVDQDTCILFLYAKGERIMHTFESSALTGKLNRLPPYSSDTQQLGVSFLSKFVLDPYNVEIAVALRLSPQAIQKVTFSIPRARTEFFQDDVFPPTRDSRTSVMSATEWVNGSNTTQKGVSLNMKNLALLSQAPPTKAQISTRNKIAAGPQKTETQKQEEYLSRLYAKAKLDDSEDEQPSKAASKVEDDDW